MEGNLRFKIDWASLIVGRKERADQAEVCIRACIVFLFDYITGKSLIRQRRTPG